mgnify:FL=1
MKIKSQKDFWSGIMFIVVGLGFAWGATNYSMGSSARPGPGYFPLGLGFLLAFLGALVVFQSLTIDTRDGDPIGPWPFKQAVIILGAVALFGLTIPRLGMAVALPLLIGISSLASGEFHWKEVLVNVVVLTVGCWLIFIKGLGLTIPLWPTFITG